MVARIKGLAFAVLLVVEATSADGGGVWIAPSRPADNQPQYKPVPLYWFSVRECPLVYRREIDVPNSADRATAALRTSGYVYVYVDARLVYGWAPRRADKRRKKPAVPADPNRVHTVDLSAELQPGRHVLAVSAPAGGFVLDGGLYDGTKRLAPLATSDKWTVTRFRPTTILEDQTVMKPGYRGPAAPAGTGDSWQADEDVLAAAYSDAAIRRIRRRITDLRWRVQLAARKGIYIHRDTAYGWGGPLRLAPALRKMQTEWSRTLDEADRNATGIADSRVKDVASLARTIKRLRALDASTRATEARMDAAFRSAYEGDLAKARELAEKVISPERKRAPDEKLEGLLGHPLNHLNQSRYDRLGWINHPHLTDSDIGRWGVRINPATGPTSIRLHHRWRFSTDPNDSGLKELRHTLGYNIAGQWPWIDGRQSWTRNPSFSGYKGIAWYRQSVHIPSEWTGGPVVLKLRLAGEGRIWLNGREITKLGRGGEARTFTIQGGHVVYGGRNCLAIRVKASGSHRGLLGPAEIACPSLDGASGKETPPVDVLATPLSPCVILQPRTQWLQLHHAGKAKVAIGPRRSGLIWRTGEARADIGSYALLWLTPSAPSGLERPILLVFERRGATILCQEGLTRVKLSGPGQRVIAVRPWVRQVPKRDPNVLSPTVGFWCRAALAVPVNYMSVTRVLRPGLPVDAISIDNVPRAPRLSLVVIYDYLDTTHDSGVKPLKLAPLPALCSFAMDCKYRTLRLDQAKGIRTLQDGGLLAPYRGLTGSDRVSYSYEIEPYPRFAGFTSWMFSPVDVGVRGNKREMELIAYTGANSYRPQHNWSNEMPPKGHFPPGDKRTRVQIMVEACKAVGINYMNNIDQTLGPRKPVREDYESWVRTRLLPHYDRLVPQLAGLPFWAAAIDLINEPFDHRAPAYNRTIRDLTARIRKLDRRHLLYVEPCQSWGAIQNIALVKPTGDPLTGYSFHDYNFRLKTADDRWPTPEQDITNIYRRWLPAIEFGIRHGVLLHCGEFGGFHAPTNDSPAQKLLLNDFFRIFDQFGMHHHYYSGRSIFIRLADGSLRPSNVVRASREYFRRSDFNIYYGRRGSP